MVADGLGQEAIDLDGDVALARVRGGPCAREGACRTSQVEGAESLVWPPQGMDHGGHVLHVLELEVGGVRGIKGRGLNAVEEQCRARAIPSDARRSHVRVEDEVA